MSRHPCSCGPLGQVLSRGGVPGPGRVILLIGKACAGEPHILFVVTIVLPPRPGRAVAQGGLTPLAVHVIEPDGPSPRAVVGLSHTRPDLSTAQLPASHGAISQVPVVITHCPPASSIPHFQPASTPVGPISQTNPKWACWSPSGAPIGGRGQVTVRLWRAFCWDLRGLCGGQRDLLHGGLRGHFSGA